MKYRVVIHEALNNVYFVDVEGPSEVGATDEAERIVKSGKTKPVRTIRIGYEHGFIEEIT